MANCCTWFPDRIGDLDFTLCCCGHDDDFYNPYLSFLEANSRLFKCVVLKTGSWFWARVIYAGVSSPIGYAFWLYAKWQVATGRL